MTYKPVIVISACLLGRTCRYDGRDKNASNIIRSMESEVVWHPICPEVEAGLPIPRPPMSLFSVDGDIRLLTNESHEDITSVLRAWIERTVPLLTDADGFILKARSPSCGPGNTPVQLISGTDTLPKTSSDTGTLPKTSSDIGTLPKTSYGLFAGAVLLAYPDKPIADEQELSTPEACRAFLKRLTP